MTRRQSLYSVLVAVLSFLSAPALDANTPVSVDVESGADQAYTVDAAFDVNVPPSVAWALTATAGGTRVTYRLRADPNGRQPVMLAKSAMRGSVRKLLDEVRDEILARAAR